MRMPFGKHKGISVADLPDTYVNFLYGLTDLREPLRSELRREWALRFGTPARGPLKGDGKEMALRILSAGYREVAQQLHPDHGGDTATMQAVNQARDFLRDKIREAMR